MQLACMEAHAQHVKVYVVLALTSEHLCSSCSSLNIISDLRLNMCVLEPAVASCVQRPVDLVFLLDGSERMGLENHRRAKEFIENVARRLTLASGPDDDRNARLALLQYGSPQEQRVEFKLSHNLTVISDSLAGVTYMDSSSALGSAIIHAVNNLVFEPGSNQVQTYTYTHTYVCGRFTFVWTICTVGKFLKALCVR